MFKNYFIVAFRSLIRHKTFSMINIGGLAIGLAAFWMIALYVGNEISYDSYHANASRIFRVVQHASWDGGKLNAAVTPAPLAPAFKSEFPEVLETTRFDMEGGGTITYADKKLMVNDILFTDSSVFKIFSYHFLYGDPGTALVKPQTIVLTKTLAQKLFGDVSLALNKTLSFGENEGNLVTGVIDDPPVNSHFTFSALRSLGANTNSSWSSSYLFTYVLVKEKNDPKKLERRFPAFYDKYIKASMGDDVNFRMELQPLRSIHLYSNLDYEMGPNGNINYVYIFSLVAALILIIASINYMNLSTARSSLRVKEIGVRKVSGSGRSQLVVMFLAESILVTAIASIIAIAILNFSMPLFRQFTGKEINMWFFGFWQTLFLLAGFSLFAGCLSGIYPALFLSGFKLIPALKGQVGSHSGNRWFRQSLVVFQFVVTIAMIGGSFIIYRQLQFVRQKDLGFNKDQVITFHIGSRDMRNNIPAIRELLLQNPLIENVATAGNPIGNNNIGGGDYKTELNGSMDPKARIANKFTIDEDFIPALQIKMATGRNFLLTMPTDRDNAVVINETLAKDAGWKDPIGKKIECGKDTAGRPLLYQVAGVVKDFNIYSLQHKIAPLILQLPQSASEKDNMYIRLSKKNVNAALKYIEDVYKKFDQSNPFEYSFLDQNFARQYETEKMQGNLLFVFTMLAISIACLGLFGLITFTAEQRRKEIGIRKVLGGSVAGIVLLLAKDLVLLVVIAIFIATPIAWLSMSKWLQGFAYQINISWWIFASAGVIALIIAFVTVGLQAVKAAIANPVKSLRTE